MSVPSRCSPPTSYLPPVRSIRTEENIKAALHNLRQLYCPLRLPGSIPSSSNRDKKCPPSATPNPADSGYVSQDEDDDEEATRTDDINVLSRDVFERDFSVRWLTSLIARADELPFDSEESHYDIIDEAAFILSSFSDPADEGIEEALTRDFSFATSFAPPGSSTVQVRLNDAPLSNTDHTDVGLQSWGASIIMSGLMCASPSRFGLDTLQPGSTVVELGAGTGLVSLTLATLLPRLPVMDPVIVATDYHPAVLENLRSNIETNFASLAPPPVHTMLLDWSAPSLEPPLDSPVSVLLAADVVYAPEHATWLRDCAGQLLASNGIFWLMVTVRQVGKFEGIADTVEAAFATNDCPVRDGRVLKILETERLEKRKGIGRGDESGYNLYKIGWTSAVG